MNSATNNKPSKKYNKTLNYILIIFTFVLLLLAFLTLKISNWFIFILVGVVFLLSYLLGKITCSHCNKPLLVKTHTVLGMKLVMPMTRFYEKCPSCGSNIYEVGISGPSIFKL